MSRIQWVGGLFPVLMLLAGSSTADGRADRCAARKINASGDFYQCLSRDAAKGVVGKYWGDRSCEETLDRKFARAERRGQCAAEADADSIGTFLEQIQVAVDDAITTGAELPDVTPSGCDPQEVDLKAFPYYANQDGYWCGDATTLNRFGEPLELNVFPYPYDNYKIFIQVRVDGADLKTKTLVIYPPESPERCEEIEEAGYANSLLPEGVCGRNGAGKVYIGNEIASDCKGGLSGVFPLGEIQFIAESKLLSDRIQAYRQETQGGALVLDDISTIQDDTWVLSGQLWNPLQPPGLTQLEGNFFDRMGKCSAVEFAAEIRRWGHKFKVPRGRLCGLDSGNNLTDESCVEFFTEDSDD